MAGTSSRDNGRILVDAVFAPIWSAFYNNVGILRGFTSQLRIGVDTYFFGLRMIFDLELRLEYDGALEVFRIPLTFS